MCAGKVDCDEFSGSTKSRFPLPALTPPRPRLAGVESRPLGIRDGIALDIPGSKHVPYEFHRGILRSVTPVKPCREFGKRERFLFDSGAEPLPQCRENGSDDG